MIQRNAAFSNLTAGYLFPEIAKRRREYLSQNPNADVISLGIGNTTEPLTPHISAAMSEYAKLLATKDGYSGYGDEQGLTALREKIAKVFYNDRVSADEVFISDGAKCDIGRIQCLFGSNVALAVQDPAYPVYVDGSVIIGAAGKPQTYGYEGITYLSCVEDNAFFPNLEHIPQNSLIYFCSPNNPTGATATRTELETLVEYARQNGCIIIFDSAYSSFIRDERLPKSIFEIEGSIDCAIEISSFSKPAGFTGIRLGWSVVPKALKYADGSSVCADWNRLMCTVFNGASNIAQHGGLAALDDEGQKEMKFLTDYYLENARLIKKSLETVRYNGSKLAIYGGDNAPYLWVRFANGKSWDIFDILLNKYNIITTPGAGFGPSGEEYIRFSAFGHRENIVTACKRLENQVF